MKYEIELNKPLIAYRYITIEADSKEEAEKEALTYSCDEIINDNIINNGVLKVNTKMTREII